MERRSPEPYPATTDVLGLADAVRRNVALVVEGKDDVVLTAVTVLFAGGHLLVECAEHQAGVAREALGAAGFDAVVHHDDDRDATVITGVLVDAP